MLQKSKSKKIFQLKYLLLVPIVLSMLVYTSCEKEVKLTDDTELSSEDEALITKLNDKLSSSNENFISMYSGLFQKHQSDDYLFTKEEFFEHELSFRKILAEMKEKNKLENPDAKPFNFEMPLPSASRYQAYVRRKKAIQLLDSNLKETINAFKQDVQLINKLKDYPANYLEFKVSNSKNLTSDELRNFNTVMLDFEKNSNKYANIIITDNTYAFHVFQKVNENVSTYKEGTVVSKVETEYTDEDTITVPFAVIEEVPVFPGCENATDKRACFNEKMQKHISKNFNYPQAAQEAGIEGRVSVMFVIQEDGSIGQLRMRGPDKLLEDEVERIIKRLPNMTPGKQKGAVVAVPFSIPVTFKLQ